MKAFQPASVFPAERQPGDSLPAAPTLSIKLLKKNRKRINETTAPAPGGLKVFYLKMAVKRLAEEEPEFSGEA